MLCFFPLDPSGPRIPYNAAEAGRLTDELYT